MNIMNKYLKIYNDLDTRCKRCIIIDLYSVLFLITSDKYIIKKNVIISLVIMAFQMIFVKGNDKNIKNFKYEYQKTKTKTKIF